MAYRRRKNDDILEEYFGPVGGTFVIFCVILVICYKYNRVVFWQWLIWGFGIVILVIAGVFAWVILSKKYRQIRMKRLLGRVNKAGLEDEFKNFIDRFGQEKKSNDNVLAYRNHRIDNGRIEDFQRHVAEKGLDLEDSQLGDLLRHYIYEKEYALTTESVKSKPKDLNSLSGSEFEIILKRLMEKMGYTVELIGGVGDQGGDLIANKDGERILIQAKRYTGSVGNAAVQEAVAAKNHYDCTAASVATTGEFTREAIELAKTNQVQLVGRGELQEKLLKYLKESWK